MTYREAKRLVEVGHAILVSEDEGFLKIEIPKDRYKIDPRAPKHWRHTVSVYFTVYKSV